MDTQCLILHMNASLMLSDENDIFIESLRRENWILLLWSYIPDYQTHNMLTTKNWDPQYLKWKST